MQKRQTVTAHLIELLEKEDGLRKALTISINEAKLDIIMLFEKDSIELMAKIKVHYKQGQQIARAIHP